MSTRGLDASEFQGVIDWERVKAAGYQFAMLRAGYGFGTVDAQFRRNVSECNRIGLPVGAYWFCYAISPETAVQEADGCLDTIAGYRLDYPIAYDIEQVSMNYASQQGVTYTPALAQAIVRSFCDRIESRGYFAMFYTNRSFLDNYLYPGLAERYAFWYARFADTFDGTDCGIWQFSNTGSIPGINGNVDLDLGFVDYPTIIRRAGLNHLDGTPSPPPSPSPSPSPSPDYTTYVIQPGDTLSEIAERFGTTVSELAAINGIRDPNLIYAGTTIRIPENGRPVYYTIRPGDTLSEIAERFGTTVSALAALNGIRDPNLIYAGTTIRIS